MTLGLVTPSLDSLRSLGMDEKSASQVSHLIQASRAQGSAKDQLPIGCGIPLSDRGASSRNLATFAEPCRR